MLKQAAKAFMLVLALLGIVLGAGLGSWAGPQEEVTGEPGPNDGVQFSTPFIVEIIGLLIDRVTDCVTGEPIPPGKLRAEFVFQEGAQAPFKLDDLQKIILKSEGYQPREITSFFKIQLQIGQLMFTFVLPLDRSLCLTPSNAVLWGERRELTWDDFKGRPDEGSEFSALTVSGFTALQWSCDEKGQFTFQGAQAHFDRSKSWVKSEGKSDELLQHEQGHFDITEIYARKLREELRKIKCDKKTQEQIQKEVDAIFERIQKEWEMEDEKYDQETDHGRNKEKQKEWNEKIQRRLEEMKGK